MTLNRDTFSKKLTSWLSLSFSETKIKIEIKIKIKIQNPRCASLLLQLTMASPQLKPSGFDYVFVPLLDDDFICLICHLGMRDPVQTTICGHRFCKECLAEFHKG